MDTRGNSTLIGAATVAIVFALFWLVDWRFGSNRSVGQSQTYELVVPDSVSGLSRGAAVQFNGLKVGEVVHLAVSEEEPIRVEVLVNIDMDKAGPIKTNTRARLERIIPNGFITGVAVVSLSGGTAGAPDLEVEPGRRYPRILAEKTEIQDLLGALERLAPVPEIMERAGAVLAVIRSAPASAEWNVETFTSTFDETSRNYDNARREAADLGQKLPALSARFSRLMASIDFKALRKVFGDSGGAGGGSSITDLVSASRLREYEQFAVGARKSVKKFDGSVRSLRLDPRRAVSGAAPAIPEQQER